MRRLVDDRHIGLPLGAWLKRYGSRVATIAVCLSEAGLHRRYVVTLAAVVGALPEPAGNFNHRASCAGGFTA